MRVKVRTTPTTQLTLERIKELTNERYKSRIIRSAIRVAHTAFMATSLERWVMRNDRERLQVDFYVGPLGSRVPSKTWPSIEAQFDSTSQPQMEDLLSRKFGSSKEDIVLRAIHLYYQILEHEKKGFRLGYLNTKGKFIAIDLFEK